MMKYLIICLVLLSAAGPSFSEQIPKEEYVKAVVLEAGKIAPEADLFRREKVQSVTLRIAGGIHKGRVITVDHAAAGGMMGKDMVLRKGDRVMLYIDENPTPRRKPDGRAALPRCRLRPRPRCILACSPLHAPACCSWRHERG